MSQEKEQRSFAFYGSDYDPQANDHFEEETEFGSLDEAVDYARGLLQRWECGAVELVAGTTLAAVVTADAVLSGEELSRGPAEPGAVWEVSFHGSEDAAAADPHTGPMKMGSWDELVKQAESLLGQWDAEYVDVLTRSQSLMARVTREGVFTPDDEEDTEAVFPEYDFYASDCDLTDPSNNRIEMGLVFDDLDGAVDYARELLSGWGCDYVDVHQDEELVARVSPEGVLTDLDFAAREE